jgi:hypothetical protein
MKKFARYLFDFSVLITLSYLTINAISTGEAQFRTLIFKYSENPKMFVVTIILMVSLTLMWAYLIGSSIFDSIDKKVKSFGGNYNINTFKAILRNTFRSR